MKLRWLSILFLFSIINSTGQEIFAEYEWWNEMHGWESGDPGWRNWMKITPGYFGPNALPIPEVKKGFIPALSEIEVSFSNHFNSHDPTQDISGRLFIPFAKNKIAVEMYGVAIEHYAFSEQIRNERIARDKDGKGFAVGDFYFSTLIQISKNRKFPNTLLRLATRTASGNQLEAARFTDNPGYFFDLSFSKEFGEKETGLIRPFGGFGFYSWQTMDELNLQNDALMYSAGIDYERNNWLFSGSCSGYSGYKNRRDRPARLNAEIQRDFNGKAVRVQYYHGLSDWNYKTIKFSFLWKFKAIN